MGSITSPSVIKWPWSSNTTQPWSEMSRGMGKEGEQLNSDEHHLRIFWRRWNQMMGAA